VGLEVITHTDQVSVPGYTGKGYIIIDPETGSGAYKIGGGQNGSFLLGAAIGLFLVSMLVISVTTGGAFLFILAGIVSYLSFVLLLFTSVDMPSEPLDATCFASGLMYGLTAAALVLGRELLSTVLTVIGLGAFWTDFPGKECVTE
jgi:hypothetical protein